MVKIVFFLLQPNILATKQNFIQRDLWLYACMPGDCSVERIIFNF